MPSFLAEAGVERLNGKNRSGEGSASSRHRLSTMSTNTFVLNREFVRTLSELYYDDQSFTLEILKKEPIENSRRIQHYEHHISSKSRIETHIRRLLEVSFWASLLKEEGRHHQFTLEYSSPSEPNFDNLLVFHQPLPFDAPTIAKLAPALESKANIGVWETKQKDGKSRSPELAIWGCVPPLLCSPLLLKAIEPGQIILSISDCFKARITGQTVEFVDEFKFRQLSDIFARARRPREENLLVQGHRSSDLVEIALAIRAHGHGGILLIVPNNGATWRHSINMKLLRFAGQPYQEAKRILERRDMAVRQLSGLDLNLHDRVRQSLELIGRLTAVDGATLVNYDLDVLGFGAKIKPAKDEEEPDRVFISTPFEGRKAECKRISETGWGMRHKSAAQFIFDQRDGAIAIVASQDGRLSVFTWDETIKNCGDTAGAVTVIEDSEFLLLGTP